MEQAPHNEPVYSQNVLEMLTLANEYTLFVEKSEDYSKEDILNYMQKIFPILYLKACLLPVIDPNNDEANERYVTGELWENIFSILRKKFQKDDEYWYIDNSDISETDPIRASLSDNIADIYQDLKDFVILYQKSSRDAKENAVYQCNILFESHWGYRLINALKYIHTLKYKDFYQNEDEMLI